MIDAPGPVVLLSVEQTDEEFVNELCPPFGLLVVASVLERLGVPHRLHTLLDDESLPNSVEEAVHDAWFVGFSTMSTPALRGILRASRLAADLGKMVIWGGPHATLLPETVLRDPCVHAVLRGEAEITLEPFMLWLLHRSSPGPGLCTRELGTSPIPAPCPAGELAGHRWSSIEVSRYLQTPEHSLGRAGRRTRRALPFMTSKGCRMACTFCYNQVVNQRIWRGYPDDRVIGEMDRLIADYGIDGWYFYDDSFFTDRDRAWRILERYRMPSFIEMHASGIDETFVQRALSANVAQVYVGGESGSDRTLRLLRKGLKTERLRNAVRLCSAHGLPVAVSVMGLFPFETDHDLELTLKLVEELRTIPLVSVDGPKVYNPYPGTECYDQLLATGWTPPGSSQGWAKYTRRMALEDTGFTRPYSEALLARFRRVAGFDEVNPA